MGDTYPTTGKWEEITTDILVRIMQSFHILELTSSGIPRVCRTWRVAACDPLLWKKIDLTILKSNFIKIPTEPFVYVHKDSDKTVTRALKIALSLSHGNTTTLFLHLQLYLSDEQLTYVAERCPQLKRLVLPAWNRIRKTGLCNAIRKWPELESLTMPSIRSPAYVMEELALNCPNFSELKVLGTFDIRFASALVEYAPRLKVLSLRCSIIFKNALIAILEGLQHLELCFYIHKMICVYIFIS
uniref:F-box domain-containing protein n=1 Tax=Kalanchoe fedtschenkoi TaxID=63787 RepID=A0A7N0UAC2_KALFE